MSDLVAFYIDLKDLLVNSEQQPRVKVPEIN